MKFLTKWLALLLILCFLLPCTVYAYEQLVPVGQLIGLELGDDRVVVAAFDKELGKAAEASGLRVGDHITKINGKPISCTNDVGAALRCSDGEVQVVVLRGGKAKELKLTPEITKDGPKLGVYLKQGITGVGTVTWYDPDTGRFGALGHGVNNQNGELLTLKTGNAYRAAVASVVKGRVGTPGQLMGQMLDPNPIGTIEKNTDQGVFGQAKEGWAGEALPVADSKEIRAGKATIRSNISGQEVQEYSVEILKIYPSGKQGGRNMLLKITDPQLLDSTGGIVQGMSGSPIIQDGKLVGAVTHVLVNDPTTGYGIFIENMLDAAA